MNALFRESTGRYILVTHRRYPPAPVGLNRVRAAWIDGIILGIAAGLALAYVYLQIAG